ncbi:MAG: phosphomannomutase/phosphoglucomutase [Pseudomonadota bacterium]
MTALKNMDIETHNFDPSILREYDIRGIVGETLNDEDALTLGKAFGTKIIQNGGSHVCIAYDGRLSSPSFAENLAAGLQSTGCNVENLGLGPTPMLYFAVKDRKTDGGIMITGSHNPSSYNGFKMMLQKKSVFGDDIQELGRIAASGDFAQGNGAIKTEDIQAAYVDRLMRDFSEGHDLTIVWDNGNGATGNILKHLVEKLPGTHHLLYGDIDGNFPNHHPDPTVDKNLGDLKRTVLEKEADLGVAFDGDGDRIGVVDEQGNIIRCDLLLTLYAKEILEKAPQSKIIADVKCSKILFEEIEKMKGVPVMCQTGHSLVKNKMIETSSPLAGELSGHIFFNDIYYGFDDALYCAIRLLNIVNKSDKKVSDYFAHLPKMVSTPEIRVDIEEEKKFPAIEGIKKNLKEENDNSFEMNDLDGVRVTTNEGWWLLRASNTQNCLVSRVEAETQKGLENLQSMVEKTLEEVDIKFSFSNQE